MAISTEIPLSQILRGRKVVIATPPAGFAPEAFSAFGAKGILVLDAKYVGPECIAGTVVQKRLARLKDVYTNNCEVAILHGNSSLILSKKYKFQGFEKILVPLGLPVIGAAVGLLRYAKRGDLRLAGRARIADRGRETSYLVFMASWFQRRIMHHFRGNLFETQMVSTSWSVSPAWQADQSHNLFSISNRFSAETMRCRALILSGSTATTILF